MLCQLRARTDPISDRIPLARRYPHRRTADPPISLKPLTQSVSGRASVLSSRQRFTCVCSSCLSFLRALATRVFTVPCGIPRACAVSRVLKPSRSLSSNVRHKIGDSFVDSCTSRSSSSQVRHNSSGLGRQSGSISDSGAWFCPRSCWSKGICVCRGRRRTFIRAALITMVVSQVDMCA
jgi:hypothetical protein